MLFFGAFIVRYRLELILAFPLVALVMAQYLALSFKADSAVQRPEGLYREPGLMAAVICCTAVMVFPAVRRRPDSPPDLCANRANSVA